jgi:DNA invertase Pin-like site-specific DNA recombinase
VSRLPRSIDELRGLRAARWIRESTSGQFDRYGPDAQRELEARSIARLGLIDAGLEYSAAQSGSTVHSGPAMRAMLADAAAGAFDVLVVGYVARWQRNLRQTLNLLEEDLHPAGVAVWFADEELLSSNDRHWDQLVDEAKGAESWLRKHRRRVAEGYAAKRATKRDPGGHPPFGFRRNEAKLLEADPELGAVVSTIYDLAAARATDREIAAAVNLSLYTVRGVVTSPLYVGRLRTGERAHWPPLVEPALWEEVQAVRARRRTRDGRPGRRRPYALTMLHCAACGRHLIGDTGRMRHPDPCPEFVAVRREPRARARGQRRGMPGHSYRAEAYEAIVRDVLAEVSLGADVVAATVALTRDPEPDRLALARIGRDRDAAVARYRRDRDARVLEATMAALDEQETAAARSSIRRLCQQQRSSSTCATCRGCGTRRRRRAAASPSHCSSGSRSSASAGCESRPRPRRSPPGSSRRFRADLLVMVGARGLAASVPGRSTAVASRSCRPSP